MFHTPAHKASADFAPSQFDATEKRSYDVEVRTDDGIKTVQVVAENRVKAGLAAARLGHEVLTVMAAKFPTNG